jgi:hypothetical protein
MKTWSAAFAMMAAFILLGACDRGPGHQRIGNPAKDSTTETPFLVDLSGTEFTLLKASPPMFFYTPNGKPYSGASSDDVILILGLGTPLRPDSAKIMALRAIGDMQSKGMDLHPVEARDRMVGSMPAYEYVGTGQEANGQVHAVYVLATGNGKGTYVLFSTLSHHQDILLKEVEKIAGTLRGKEG